MESNIGQKFGRLTIISIYKKPKPERYKNQFYVFAVCACDCGKHKDINVNNIKRGITKSCGCLLTEVITKHGFNRPGERHPLYSIHNAMQERCVNPNTTHFNHYGGRGIKVCDQWLHNAGEFVRWGLANGWVKGLTLERNNVNGNYEPSNCKFISRGAQSWNLRKNIQITVDGVTKCLSAWAKFYGLTRNTLAHRIRDCKDPSEYAKCLYNKNPTHDPKPVFNHKNKKGQDRVYPWGAKCYISRQRTREKTGKHIKAANHL
jgi:hypothetical protein